MPRSVPRSNRSILVVPGWQTAPGPLVHWPPSDVQPPQAPALKERLHRAPSWPTAKTSSLPEAHEETSGLELSTPPSPSQGCQAVPFQERCHMALSWPRAKVSRRPVAHDAASGSDVMTPPSDAQVNAKACTWLEPGTITQPLSSVGVANRVWPLMGMLKRWVPVTASKPYSVLLPIVHTTPPATIGALGENEKLLF